MSYKNVIIIGAGGNLGPSVLKAFLSSSFSTSVLTREGSTSTFPSGVNVIRADYDNHESLKKAFQGQDAVISLVGGTALGDQQKLIDASIAASVKRFFPSEFGSNTPNPRTREVVPLFEAKTGAVAYLKSKENAISWTSVITGPFFDWGLKVGFLGFNLQEHTFTIVDSGDATFSTTNLLYVGKALVAALEKAGQTENQYVYVSEFQISQNELLKAAEEISGKKFTVDRVSAEDHIALGNKLLSEGNHAGVGPLIQSITFGDEGLGDLSKNGLWNEKLGLEAESIEDSIRAGFAGKLLHEV
ncbi:isoflavone reductase family protein [Didymella exigua CBS 183.55]|uniref:Isoflavone reductase family protein n=1 Tax=Didymella exigua CBS 183.55 TaxID=1150837 RepID=A0A6A5RLR5_9PLEO|nr:isoflavone reductase family protein [Didymella exigua CBS 183.55]KAF1929371.1 isoflavone reductase family protein [Didymella exigua CBS 183.55]